MTDQTRSIIPQWRRDSLKKALDEGPRNLQGDPAFESIAQLEKYFTPAEIVWLANRALYQEDYQRSYHKKRAEKKKEQRQEQRTALLSQRLTQTLQGGAPPPLDVVSTSRRRVLTEREEVAALEQALPELDPVPTLEEVERERLLNEAFASYRMTEQVRKR